MHLFYTFCIIYELRAAPHSERVNKAVRGPASIQHGAFRIWRSMEEERHQHKLYNQLNVNGAKRAVRLQ